MSCNYKYNNGSNCVSIKSNYKTKLYFHTLRKYNCKKVSTAKHGGIRLWSQHSTVEASTGRVQGV